MTMIALLLAAQAATAAMQVGVAGVLPDGRVCVAIEGPRLSNGSAVVLVQTDTQSSAVVAVERAVDSCEPLARHTIGGPYYLVTRPAKVKLDDGLWLAIAGRRTVGGRARSCTSGEGLHLTLWAGVPLKSTRVWHAYYYLGYDVEPSCQEPDYAP